MNDPGAAEAAGASGASGASRAADVTLTWRGAFTSSEVNRLHAEAFETRVFSDAEWDWWGVANSHSLGWVVARTSRGSGDGALVGFVNVISDGAVHAWIQDVMVAASARGQSIGTRLVRAAADAARAAGCEWLHVDFENDLQPFYFGACGFKPTNGGLISLAEPGA